MRFSLTICLVVCAIAAGIILYPALFTGQLPSWLWNSQEQSDRNLVLFTGDVFLGRAVERWYVAQPTAQPLAQVDDLIQSYEALVINFEAAIPAVHQPTPDYGFQFSVATSALARLPTGPKGFAGLANNHSYDFGLSGYKHTQTALRQADITPFAHPLEIAGPTTVTAGGYQIALLGINAVGTSVDQQALQDVVAAAASSHDFVVPYVHWGVEYELTPTKKQKDITQTLVTAGADVVIGHHPHVVQTVEYVAGVPVLYSLGNTVFDQYFSQDVQTGLLAGLAVRDGEVGIVMYPISSIHSPHQPALLKGVEATAYRADVAARSGTTAQAAIRAGWLPLTPSQAKSLQ